MRTKPKDPQAAGPVTVLFSAYHRQVLGLLLLRPAESFHTREIARLTGIPAGSLHRELKALTEAGLLTRQPLGNQVRYQAERGCPVYEELAAIFRKTSGLANVLRDALATLDVELAFIFGSVARGQERVTSDVDVCVIGAASFASVVKALAQTHERLGREINPVVMTRRAFRTKLVAGDAFVSRIGKEPKILVTGSVHELGKLVEDRAAETP